MTAPACPVTDPQRSYVADMESQLDDLLRAGARSIRASDFVAVHRQHQWARPSIHRFLEQWTDQGRLRQLTPSEWASNAE